MNKHGLIYELTDEQREALNKGFEETQAELEIEKLSGLREDVARLDGYLKARAEADAPKISPNRDLTRRRADG